MTTWYINSVIVVDGEVQLVAMSDIDPKRQPESERHVTASPDELLKLLDAGHELQSYWINLPTADGKDDAQGIIPVESSVLPNGRRTVEIVNTGQPDGYRKLSDLPRTDGKPNAVGYWNRIRLTGYR